MLNRGDRIDFDLVEGNIYGNPQGLVMSKTNPEAEGKFWVAKVEWVEIGDGLIEPDHVLIQTGRRKHVEELERLCQVLLRAGYGQNVALEIKGELSATKLHLADMQRLVFHGFKGDGK